MSELTLNQIHRIDRALLSRHRKRELTSVQKFDHFLVWAALAWLSIILGALLLVKAEWQPGRQNEIASEYRATRHQAVALDWR